LIIKTADLLASNKLLAEEYVVDVAGLGKLALEAEIETADELAALAEKSGEKLALLKNGKYNGKQFGHKSIEVAKGAEKSEIIWVNHGYKHIPDQNIPWKKIVESTKGNGVAKYVQGKKLPAIEALERKVWENGIPATNNSLTKGKLWKLMKFDEIIGAYEGTETQYIVVKGSKNGPIDVIHGHPISEKYYKDLLQS
jgi:hypothetical protein